MNRTSRSGRLALLAAGALAAAAAQPLGAQAPPPDYPRLVIEGRVGATFPVGPFRTGGNRGGAVEPAPTFGLHFVYRGLNGWGSQLGFSQHRFDCSADGCPRPDVLTTWDLGAQRTLGASGRVWLRVAGVFGRLERDFAPGSPLAGHRVSRLSVGGEARAGVRIPIRGRLVLTPGGGYGWFNTRFPHGPLVRIRWALADLGVAIGF